MPPVEIETPPEPFTCEWAKQGLAKALEGWTASTGGVEGYGIGSRWVRYKTASDQQSAVEQWTRLVNQYCGTAILLPGVNSACRIIPRDV
jgi:hypothetical protein